MNHPSLLNDPRADELLAIRCQLGERDAFEALVNRWHGPLLGYLQRLAIDHDTAQDLAQETWLRVFRGVVRLRDPARLRSWLFGIARRAAMDRLRVKYSQGLRETLDPEAFAAIEPDMNLEEDFATLDAGVASLPMIEREALTLFHLRELSLEQIADLTGVPVGTVKSRLFRARQLVRLALQTEGVR